jgi:hypothetical protein
VSTSEEMEKLFEGVVCVFGLKNQGHIPTIERMLSEGKSWEDIGREINWCPKTAEKHYQWYLKSREEQT